MSCIFLSEVLRLLIAPNRLGYSEAHIDIQFNMVPNAAFYLVETTSSTGIQVPSMEIIQVPGQLTYNVRIQGLQRNTMYTLIVTPYISVWNIPVRGYSSPQLNFYTENPPFIGE